MISNEKLVELLPVIRQHLAYTWQDQELDVKLTEYIKDGVAYLERIAGGNVLTFDEGTGERRLLKDYVFYANALKLDTFFVNYLHDLNSFQLEQERVAYERAKESTE